MLFKVEIKRLFNWLNKQSLSQYTYSFQKNKKPISSFLPVKSRQRSNVLREDVAEISGDHYF